MHTACFFNFTLKSCRFTRRFKVLMYDAKIISQGYFVQTITPKDIFYESCKMCCKKD